MSLAPDQGALNYLKLFFTRMGYVPSLVISFYSNFQIWITNTALQSFNRLQESCLGILHMMLELLPDVLRS